MNKQLTLGTYRFIDIIFVTTLMVVFEVIAVKAVGWFQELYSISLFFVFALLVMMRWGAWSTITIVAGAVTYCWANKATFENYVIYICGNLFILLICSGFYSERKVSERLDGTIRFQPTFWLNWEEQLLLLLRKRFPNCSYRFSRNRFNKCLLTLLIVMI